MIVYGLDPGTTQSAIVGLDSAENRVVMAETWPNEQLLEWCREQDAMHCVLVIERIENMGMSAIGDTLFETVFWSGRFAEAWGEGWHRVTRREVKLHLCGTMRAKDPNVRQALLDVFGGSDAKGTKAKPGPLYGVSGHEFAALAVAVTWLDTKQEKPK